MTQESQVHIRQALPDEAEIIGTISRTAYAHFNHRIRPRFQALTQSSEAIQREIDALQSIYGLAFVDEKPVGHIRYEIRPGCLYISRLAVLPDMRGRGIAAHLMKWQEDEALRWDITRLVGEVRSALPRLLQYYHGMGYRITGYRDLGGVSKCLVIIEKHLSPSKAPQQTVSSDLDVVRLDLLHPALTELLSARSAAQQPIKAAR